MVDHRRSPGPDPDVVVNHVLISFNLAVPWDSKQVIKAVAEQAAHCSLTQDLEMS